MSWDDTEAGEPKGIFVEIDEKLARIDAKLDYLLSLTQTPVVLSFPTATVDEIERMRAWFAQHPEIWNAGRPLIVQGEVEVHRVWPPFVNLEASNGDG